MGRTHTTDALWVLLSEHFVGLVGVHAAKELTSNHWISIKNIIKLQKAVDPNKIQFYIMFTFH